MLTPYEIARKAVQALDSKKARDITVLKTEKVSSLADYFIIATATSSTHGKSLVEETEKQLSEAGEPPLRREGYRSGSWVLLDFGCVVVHVFMQETREFYNLERLWSDAVAVDISTMIEGEE
ncbi:MAG: ribosome silencing factor [Oscillospiraceae bacterium]|nr:ribosome silencing factor [Oscillospiraceae bacterium]